MNGLARAAARAVPPLFWHVWSSTIFLAIALLVVVALRKRLTAAARFAIVFIGVLKFAIPDVFIEPIVRRLFPASPPIAIPAAMRGAFTLPATVASTPIWPAMVLGAWLALALVLIIRLSATRHRLVALAVRTARAPEPRESAALARARQRLGIRRSIDIARCALPEAPALLRVLRPLVVLPAEGCDDLSDDELESLLRHECAHVARHDNLVARIESLIAAVFWFHPLIWIAQRIAAIERERACDEIVAASAAETKTYLGALYKFCQASIAPRLPGVSCMATSRLKERIEHVMNYPNIQSRAISPRRITAIASVFLGLFTIASAVIAADRKDGDEKPNKAAYAVRIMASRGTDGVTVSARISDKKTQELIAEPKVLLDASGRGDARSELTSSSGKATAAALDATPGSNGDINVVVTISDNGKVVQQNRFVVVAKESGMTVSKFTGDPITLRLADADLRDVIGTFGKLTGMQMDIDPDVRGKVTVSWQNVPWDEAFDSLLSENGLTYKIEGKTIHVSKK